GRFDGGVGDEHGAEDALLGGNVVRFQQRVVAHSRSIQRLRGDVVGGAGCRAGARFLAAAWSLSCSYFSRSFGIDRTLLRQNSSDWHQSMAAWICCSVRPSAVIISRAASRHLLVILGGLHPLAMMRWARCSQTRSIAWANSGGTSAASPSDEKEGPSPSTERESFPLPLSPFPWEGSADGSSEGFPEGSSEPFPEGFPEGLEEGMSVGKSGCSPKSSRNSTSTLRASREPDFSIGIRFSSSTRASRIRGDSMSLAACLAAFI